MLGNINLDILEGGKPVDKATQIPEKKVVFYVNHLKRKQTSACWCK